MTETLIPGAAIGDGELSPGRVVQVIGPVVDVEFPVGSLPEINFMLTLVSDIQGETQQIALEVAQHIGSGVVRAIALKPTDGVRRGQQVINTGAPIKVPVGPGILGHVYNVLGEPLDSDKSEINAADYWPITGRRRGSRTSSRRPRSSRPASRSSTCSSPTSRAARSGCSAVPVSARPSSSRR
jgi:F-type H+-transporting ATPase subunit beta